MDKVNKKSHVFIKILIILIIIIVLIILYGRYINTKGLKVKETPIYNETLPSAYNGLKIAHFSDVHYGRTTNEEDLEKVINAINEYKPDIIIFTGDLFDSNKISEKEQESVTKALESLEANLFKLAVIGDYDTKYLETYKEILNDSEFILLDNENKLIYHNSNEPLNFIGITEVDEKTSDLYTDNFNITLMHKPDNITKLEHSTLVFAGHSLGGQVVIPFIGGIIKQDGANTYLDEHYTVNDKELYISNGIGTQKYSFRLFNKPSITLYRLYSK